MNKVLIVITILLIAKPGFSQNDSLLLKQLSKSVTNCERLTLNAQRIITEFSINQTDSIYKVLQIWESQCGKTEPVERLKILSDIQQDKFVDTAYKTYILQLVTKYKNRITSSKQDNYRQIFEFDKAYFDYLPLRSNFDSFTKEIAQDLLSKQRKGTSEYLFCILFTDNFEEFNNLLNSHEYENSYFYKSVYSEIDKNYYNSWTTRMNFKLSSGIWLPVKKLSETFKISPQIGAFFGYQLYNNFYLDLGIFIRPLINDENFDLNTNNTANSVNGTVCLTFGVWLYNGFKLNKNLFMDIIGGIGLGRIDTDLKRPEQYSDDVDKYYGVSTYDASVGINLRKRIFEKSSIGLNLSYHYAPYNNDNLLKTQLGNQFLTMSIIFRISGI
jgi:hypothetical protein